MAEFQFLRRVFPTFISNTKAVVDRRVESAVEWVVLDRRVGIRHTSDMLWCLRDRLLTLIMSHERRNKQNVTG